MSNRSPRTGPDDERRLAEALAGSVVAGRLEPFDWDQEAAIAYAVAQDSIGFVIASYTGLIADENRSGAPSRARLAQYEDAITRVSAQREALRGADRAECERVSAECAAECRRLFPAG